MDVKKKVFAELEQFIAPETILATNTSSLSITEMASGLEHPERVVGFHFFNPVAVLPLLEIIKGSKTDDATLATAFATAKSLKKSAVLCGDKAGFVFNRLVTRTLGEVMSAVDEGTPFDVADNAIAELGMPMSPFTLLALVGPAVALHHRGDPAGVVPGPVQELTRTQSTRRGPQARRVDLGRERSGRRPRGRRTVAAG